MAYASRSGRARVSSRNPQAFSVCDRCGIWHNLVDLTWQYDWRGPRLQNLRFLVCKRCLDVPQEQLRTIVLPPDPVPVMNARVENFLQDETDYRSISEPTVYDPITGIPVPGTNLRTTEDCQNRTLLPFGVPVGLDPNAVMPYNGAIQQEFGEPLSILSVTSNGTSLVQVTCSKVHGLQTNSQVAVRGLSYGPACGTYSVNVLTATAFTYMTYGSNPSGSLLAPDTLIITALVGLPLGYAVIPKIEGPTLIGINSNVCYLETEDGTGMFLLEDGSGYIQLEMCNPTPELTYLFELENSTGNILLEDGTDFLELEDGP